jgi:hypothetical protein
MSARRTLLVVLVSALAGAGAVLRWQSSISAQHRGTTEPRGIREEFIATRALELRNDENPLLTVGIDDDYVGIMSYGNGGPWVAMDIYPGGRASVHIYGSIHGKGGGDVLAIAEDDGFMVSGGANPVFGRWTQLLKPGFFGQIHELMSTSRPTGKSFDDVIPTEDLRLRNRNGWRFASMGLTDSGDPGIAFADSKGVVRAVWVLRQRPRPGPDWWEVSIFDKSAHLRVSLELHPGKPPDLVLFADDIGGQYYTDFDSGKLTRKHDSSQSALPWLSQVQAIPARPVQLLDNRHRKLWSAP